MTTSAVRDLDIDALAELIGRARLDLTAEFRTQAELMSVLTRLGPHVQREVRLGPGERIDFLIGGIGVEVKLLKSASREAEVLRQLGRYAAHASVRALILASNRAMNVPSLIGGKPARFVSLGRAWL